jgi:hypothetical protein
MKNLTLASLLMLVLGSAGYAPVNAEDDLLYVAVEPCRIADTRTTQGGTGPLAAGEERAFKVYGDLFGQGGDVCEHPRADTGVEPLAASVYLVAVGGGVKNRGFLTAFPTDEVPGTVATLNYDKNQVIGNTTIVTLCQPGSCPTDGQLGLTSSDSQNVVMDIQGYFYPLSGGDQVVDGQWEGSGEGIYMDGTTSDISIVTGEIFQEEGSNFFYGTASLTSSVSGTQLGQISGHIQGSAIKGVFGGCIDVAPDCFGAAIFEGKLTGDVLNATVQDLNDGSTGTLTLQRTSP